MAVSPAVSGSVGTSNPAAAAVPAVPVPGGGTVPAAPGVSPAPTGVSPTPSGVSPNPTCVSPAAAGV
ncbi:MAG: 1-acyl-sn-glycerol-3-phosphate acyltransferase, partial [Planctomycetaceae bacterium]